MLDACDSLTQSESKQGYKGRVHRGTTTVSENYPKYKLVELQSCLLGINLPTPFSVSALANLIYLHSPRHHEKAPHANDNS